VKQNEGGIKKKNWDMNNHVWLEDGSFVVGQSNPPHYDKGAIYYYDKNQNKEWIIADNFKQDFEEYGKIKLINMKETGNNKFRIVYSVYNKEKDLVKYFAETLNFGEKIIFDRTKNKEPLFKTSPPKGVIFGSYGSKFINDHIFIYRREFGRNKYKLSFYNFKNNTKKEIISTNYR
jgi:hypothetical protein